MEEKIILAGEPVCDVVSTCDVPMTTPIDTNECSECNIETPVVEMPVKDGIDCINVKFTDLATVLQDSVLLSWKMHLKAKKYSTHMILQEYYDDAIDIIDGFIEHYQGICKCEIVKCDVRSNIVGGNDPISYFTNLKDYVSDFANDSSNFNDRTFEIKSDIDDLLRLIDSTLYKLTNLTESVIKSFDAFVYENLN